MCLYNPKRCRVHSIVEKQEYLLLIKFELIGTNPIFINIGITYLKPGKEYTALFNKFEETTNEVIPMCSEALMIGGDFNARMGENNVLTDIQTTGTVLATTRDMIDDKINQAGIKLTNLMNDLNMYILNRRTPGDIPGCFTPLGVNGKSPSTLDYVAVNQDMALMVSGHEFFGSDHSIMETTIRNPKKMTCQSTGHLN